MDFQSVSNDLPSGPLHAAEPRAAAPDMAQRQHEIVMQRLEHIDHDLLEILHKIESVERELLHLRSQRP